MWQPGPVQIANCKLLRQSGLQSSWPGKYRKDILTGLLSAISSKDGRDSLTRSLYLGLSDIENTPRLPSSPPRKMQVCVQVSRIPSCFLFFPPTPIPPLPGTEYTLYILASAHSIGSKQTKTSLSVLTSIGSIVSCSQPNPWVMKSTARMERS